MQRPTDADFCRQIFSDVFQNVFLRPTPHTLLLNIILGFIYFWPSVKNADAEVNTVSFFTIFVLVSYFHVMIPNTGCFSFSFSSVSDSLSSPPLTLHFNSPFCPPSPFPFFRSLTLGLLHPPPSLPPSRPPSLSGMGSGCWAGGAGGRRDGSAVWCRR